MATICSKYGDIYVSQACSDRKATARIWSQHGLQCACIGRELQHTHKFCSIIADRQGQLLKTACGSPCYAAPEMIAGAAGRWQGRWWPCKFAITIVVRSNHCPRKIALWCQPICETAHIVDSWNFSRNVLLYASQSVWDISFIFIFVECCSGHSYAHVSDQCVWRCRCMFLFIWFFRFFVYGILQFSVFPHLSGEGC